MAKAKEDATLSRPSGAAVAAVAAAAAVVFVVVVVAVVVWLRIWGMDEAPPIPMTNSGRCLYHPKTRAHTMGP